MVLGLLKAILELMNYRVMTYPLNNKIFLHKKNKNQKSSNLLLIGFINVCSLLDSCICSINSYNFLFR